MTFNTWEEYKGWYYKTHDCISDDEKEDARLEKFASDNGITIEE